jgi:hypothetical protein
MASFDRLSGVGPAPAPRPGSAPAAASVHPPSTAALAADRIARPAAHPLERPAGATPLRPGDALPLLAAVALVSGAAVLAAPAAGAASAGLMDAAAAAGSGMTRGAAFVKVAARAFGVAYHEGARHAAALDIGDARALGKMLGAQSWTATEELVRGAVAGAALAGGAQAAEGIAHAVGRAFAPGTPRASQR